MPSATPEKGWSGSNFLYEILISALYGSQYLCTWGAPGELFCFQYGPVVPQMCLWNVLLYLVLFVCSWCWGGGARMVVRVFVTVPRWHCCPGWFWNSCPPPAAPDRLYPRPLRHLQAESPDHCHLRKYSLFSLLRKTHIFSTSFYEQTHSIYKRK